MRNTPFTPAATFAILPHMKTILRFPRTNNIPIRAMLSALDDKFGFSSRYADVGVSTAAEVSELLAFWRPDACVVNNDNLPAKAFAAYPTVFLHRAGKSDNPRHAEVSFDEKAVAETAAHHLLSLNLAAYAYVPSDTDEEWSRERERHFVRILSLNGYGVATYIRPKSRLSVPRRLSRLADWIADLPRPVGIFAANDAVAANVTAACNHRHIDIPQDVAVIGVDDNKEMCETSRPTISSIAIDSMAVRTETLLLLEDLVAGKAPGSRHVRIEPIGVVRRASTLRAKKKDNAVLAACELIRKEACNGLKARDVAATFPCGRRMAEIRFRAVLGHSILDEIRAVRRARAKMAVTPFRSMLCDEVAALCGYHSWSSVHRLISET